MSWTQERLRAALEGMDRLEKITIEVVDGGFHWQMIGDGREVIAGEAGPEQIASMLQITEVLLNTEFGILEQRLCRPALN